MEGHYKYITELAMVLNWKCWRWWEMKRSLGELYKSLYIELDSWIHENFTGEEISYYYEVTD